MADSAGQPSAQTNPAAQPSQPQHTVAAPTVVQLDLLTESSTEPSAEPTALETVSGNAGAAAGTGPRQHGDVSSNPKPVFKMKRTGHSTIPLATPVHDRAQSSTLTPVAGGSHGPDEEPEPARVVSDILPPQLPSTPMSNPSAAGLKSKSASDGHRKTKYATDEERRRATSIALKKRWASGLMDHVHKKRLETMRRRSEAQALLGDPGITKPPGPVGSLKHTPKSSASPIRLPNLAGLTSPPAHHAQKRFLEHPDHPFKDKPSYTASGAPVPRRSLEPDNKKLDSSGSPSPTFADVEMSESPDLGVLNDQEGPAPVRDEEDAINGDGDQESTASFEMAAPDRPYTRWRDADGSLTLTYGALIPEGYQLSTITPHHPWICPVRPCRKLFAKLVQLGGHFIRAHRTARLHDNEDGTFSERGHAISQASSTKQPAIVVSKGPADPSEPPPAVPSYPTSVLRDRTQELHDLTAMEVEPDEEASASATPSAQDLDKEREVERNQEALWSYLQPYLTKHKGPTAPQLGWVRHLTKLPKVRDLDWNTPWLETHPYSDTHPRDISALVVQVTGEPAPTPCVKCREGRGPFRSCIMISLEAETGPLGAIVSCANCFYHFGQTYCGHKKWATKRASRALNVRRQHGETLGTWLEVSSDEEENNGQAEEQEEKTNTVDDDIMEYTLDDSVTEAPTTPGNVPSGISEAEPGRPYTMWPDENGELASLFGALLPAGYRLDTSIPGRPWVCPIRTCRKAHCKRSDLGFHFQRVHFAASLNDNCDGTFSIKGIYKDKRTSLGKGGRILTKAPPIVVSKEPLENASPVLQAQLPSYLAPRPSLRGLEEPEIKPAPTRVRRGGNSTAELWAYLQPHLAQTTEIPSNTSVRHLLALPRQRDVQYNPRGKRFYETAPRDIAALLIQVTGDGAPNTCNRCLKGKGPFQGCVVMPQTAHPVAKDRYPCCGNCLYGGKMTQCSLLNWVRERDQGWKSTPAQDQPSPAKAPPPEPPTFRLPEAYHTAVPLIRRDMIRPPPTRRQKSSDQPPTSYDSSSNQPAPSALISQGSFHGKQDLLEMEDWEVAPGRIRETVAAEAETIAFSKPYLSTAQAVPVCEDVAFRVDTIASGKALQLEPEANQTRLCAVAAGKVRVRIGDEPEFVVGPHGLFKVKPGVACSVRNGLYLDAVVHTTVLMG